MPALQHTAQELCELEAPRAPAGPSPSLPGDGGCDGLCGGVLLAVTAGCLKQCGSQEVSVEGLAEGKCSEVESEGPDQTLLSFKSHYSHGA